MNIERHLVNDLFYFTLQLSGMATTAMEVTISVSLIVTIGLWLSAMFTTGWFLASIRTDNTTTYVS